MTEPDDPFATPPPGTYGAPPPPPPQYGPPPPVPVWGYGYPYVPQGMYLDPVSGVVFPDGVVLASHGRRIGSWFLSFALFVVTLGIGYVIWGLIVWARGTSPAFQVLGMRAWRPSYNDVAGWWTMALRNVVGYLVEGLFLGILSLVSFIMFLVNRDNKSLRDTIASTVIVHDPSRVLARR
jgi:RDD family